MARNANNPSKAAPKRRRTRLTPRQQAFIDALLADEDMRATYAYMRAFGQSNERTAAVCASKLLKNAKVKAAIDAAMATRREAVAIEHNDVVRRLYAMLTADANDLVQYRRGACRHCYGIDHGFQWVDETEYLATCEKIADKARALDVAPDLPGDEGGYGYDASKLPHDDCPRCHGEGIGSAHIKDTRFLTGGARLIYQGVEETQFGTRVKMIDRAVIYDKLMRHLGMFNDKLTLGGDKENPLEMLLKQLPGALIRPVSETDPGNAGQDGGDGG